MKAINNKRSFLCREADSLNFIVYVLYNTIVSCVLKDLCYNLSCYTSPHIESHLITYAISQKECDNRTSRYIISSP